MEMKWQGGESESGPVEAQSNIIPLDVARSAARPVIAPQPYLTDAERIELRAMLAWYREIRPQFEALKHSCPTARFLLAND